MNAAPGVRRPGTPPVGSQGCRSWTHGGTNLLGLTSSGCGGGSVGGVGGGGGGGSGGCGCRAGGGGMLRHQGSLFSYSFTSLPETQPEGGSVHPALSGVVSTPPHTGRGGTLSQTAQVVSSCTVQHIHTPTTTTTALTVLGILGFKIRGNRVIIAMVCCCSA